MIVGTKVAPNEKKYVDEVHGNNCQYYTGWLSPYSNPTGDYNFKRDHPGEGCLFGDIENVDNELDGGHGDQRGGVDNPRHADAMKLDSWTQDTYCTLSKGPLKEMPQRPGTVECTFYRHPKTGGSDASHEICVTVIGFVLALTILAVELVESKAASARASWLMTATLGVFVRLRRFSSWPSVPKSNLNFYLIFLSDSRIVRSKLIILVETKKF